MIERGDRPSQRTLVIIPTYNERENLPLIVGRVHAARPDVHVLVVDDGSPDGTGELADELSLADPDRIHVMHRASKAGLGAAYLAGFAWGLGRGYSVLVEMDADGSHAPEELYRLLDAVDAAPTWRSARATSTAAPCATGRGAGWCCRGRRTATPGSRSASTSTTSPPGYRAYRREVLEKIELATVDSKGYCFQIEMTWRTITAGFSVVEVPITFTERELGKSKMSGSNIREAIFKVAEWGVRGRIDRARGAVR